MKDKTTLDYIDLLIFNALIRWVQNNRDERPTLTYKQVVEQVNHPSVIPVNLSPRFGRILHYCVEHNIPVITALVVKKNGSEPGAGFFEALGIQVAPEKRREYWESMCEQVYNYEHWDDHFIGPKAQ